MEYKSWRIQLLVRLSLKQAKIWIPAAGVKENIRQNQPMKALLKTPLKK